jgi:hypothetical protein
MSAQPPRRSRRCSWARALVSELAVAAVVVLLGRCCSTALAGPEDTPTCACLLTSELPHQTPWSGSGGGVGGGGGGGGVDLSALYIDMRPYMNRSPFTVRRDCSASRLHEVSGGGGWLGG